MISKIENIFENDDDSILEWRWEKTELGNESNNLSIHPMASWYTVSISMRHGTRTATSLEQRKLKNQVKDKVDVAKINLLHQTNQHSLHPVSEWKKRFEARHMLYKVVT